MLTGLPIGSAGVVDCLIRSYSNSTGDHLAGALYLLGGAVGPAVGNVLLTQRSGGDL